MQTKHLLGVFLVPSLLLLVPLVAMQFVDGMVWRWFDFAVAWVLMVSAGLAYRLVASRTGSVAYRSAVGVAVATMFMLVWGNLAVGFIGNEDNPANLLYLGVLAVGIIGAGIVRFKAHGMARVLFATALVQFLVPVIALIIWRPELTLGVAKVFVFNGVFVMLFVGSALLFRRSARGEVAQRAAAA